MKNYKDFSDSRFKGACIHCDASIDIDIDYEDIDEDVEPNKDYAESNKDHVPTRSLLSKNLRKRGKEYDTEQVAIEDKTNPYDYLPQVTVCKACNSSFSKDETYLLCALHAVIAGGLRPDPATHPEASNVLGSNGDIVKSLEKTVDHQLKLFDDKHVFAIFPDISRVKNVVVKNARGHTYYELGQATSDSPSDVLITPFVHMSKSQRESFEDIPMHSGLWPEVGSRHLSRMVASMSGEAPDEMPEGWITVEEKKYRYAIDFAGNVRVRTVIWEYLATEVVWDNDC